MRNLGVLLYDCAHLFLSCGYAVLTVVILYMRFFNNPRRKELIWHHIFSIALLFGVIGE